MFLFYLFVFLFFCFCVLFYLFYHQEQEGWFNWDTGTYYEGGQLIVVNAPLDSIPLFARAGAIIPTQRPSESQRTTIFVRVFPRPSVPSYFTATIYWDDDTSAYSSSFALQKKGAEENQKTTLVELWELCVTATSEELVLSATTVSPSSLMLESIEWVLPLGEERSVRNAATERRDTHGCRCIRLQKQYQ